MSGRSSESPADDRGKNPHGRRKWAVLSALLVLAVAGSLSVLLSSSQSFSAAETTSLCPRAKGAEIVASGASQGVAVVSTGRGWTACDAQGGTETWAIPNRLLTPPISVVAEAVDGSGANTDILVIVHLGQRTKSVGIYTVLSKASLLARGDGFEIMRAPVEGAREFSPPWNRAHLLHLGEVVGYSEHGRVTGQEPFSWCPNFQMWTPSARCEP